MHFIWFGNQIFAKISKSTTTPYDDRELIEGVTYYYKVTAVDKVIINPHESGFSNTVSTTIRAEEEEKKTSSGGSGDSSGGSTTTSDDTMKDTSLVCMKNWSCSEWSDCDTNNVKIRTCVDLNECEDALDKPEEMDYCVQSKEEEVELTTKDNQLDFDFEEDEEKAEPEVTDDELKKSGFSKITGAVIGGGVTSFMSLIALFLLLGLILFVHRKRLALNNKASTKKKK